MTSVAFGGDFFVNIKITKDRCLGNQLLNLDEGFRKPIKDGLTAFQTTEGFTKSAELWQKLREVGDNSNKAFYSLYVCRAWHLAGGFDLFRIILKAISS